MEHTTLLMFVVVCIIDVALPAVTVGPSNTVVAVGETATFNCTIDNATLLAWKFQKTVNATACAAATDEGLPRTIANSTKYVTDTYGTFNFLTVNSVQLNDSWLYSCLDSSGAEQAAQLIVVDGGCSASYDDIFIAEQEVLTISCIVKCGGGRWQPVVRCFPETQGKVVQHTITTDRVSYNQTIVATPNIDEVVFRCVVSFNLTDALNNEGIHVALNKPTDVELWTSTPLRVSPVVRISPSDQFIFSHGDVLTCSSPSNDTAFSWIDLTTNSTVHEGARLKLDLIEQTSCRGEFSTVNTTRSLLCVARRSTHNNRNLTASKNISFVANILKCTVMATENEVKSPLITIFIAAFVSCVALIGLIFVIWLVRKSRTREPVTGLTSTSTQTTDDPSADPVVRYSNKRRMLSFLYAKVTPRSQRATSTNNCSPAAAAVYDGVTGTQTDVDDYTRVHDEITQKGSSTGVNQRDTYEEIGSVLEAFEASPSDNPRPVDDSCEVQDVQLRMTSTNSTASVVRCDQRLNNNRTTFNEIGSKTIVEVEHLGASDHYDEISLVASDTLDTALLIPQQDVQEDEYADIDMFTNTDERK